MKTPSKDISLSTLASTVSSLLVLVPVLWFIGKPLIATALAEDIKDVVKQEVAPINAAFTVLLDRDINSLKRQIAALRFKQSQGDAWTADDARLLADMMIELDALEAAKEELKSDD
jgi:hypothetical protein